MKKLASKLAPTGGVGEYRESVLVFIADELPEAKIREGFARLDTAPMLTVGASLLASCLWLEKLASKLAPTGGVGEYRESVMVFIADDLPEAKIREGFARL